MISRLGSFYAGQLISRRALLCPNTLLQCSFADDASKGRDDSAEADEGGAAAGAPGGLRKSLSEVLGQELAESLAKAASSQGPTEAELDALFGGATASSSPESRGAPEGRSGGGPGKLSSSSHAAAALHGPNDAAAGKLVHARYGYAALGGILPAADVAPSAGGEDNAGVGRGGSGAVASSLLMSFQAQPRLHPGRSFVPGQSYEPSDLNAYAEVDAGPRSRRQVSLRSMPSAAEARQVADYKNVAFLERFISPSGRLLPRKMTKLPVLDHKHVAGQIKIARSMGLMAHETRLEKVHLRRVREAELRQAHEQGIL